MIYEATISYISIDEKGKDKRVKENFLVENALSFAEVETLLAMDFGERTEFDVIAIKRSRIHEIANAKEKDNKIFLAEVADVFLQDDGSEKDVKYTIAIWAENIEKAHALMSEYLKQGYSMVLRGIKETNFIDVLDIAQEADIK